MGWQCPSPGDLPDPGIEPTSLLSPALADGFLTTRALGKPFVPAEELKHVVMYVPSEGTRLLL